jgi:hypothetical protein
MQRAIFASRHATQYTHILRGLCETSQKIKYRPRKPTCVPWYKDSAREFRPNKLSFLASRAPDEISSPRPPPPRLLFAFRTWSRAADENLLFLAHTRSQHFLWISLSHDWGFLVDYSA